MINKNTRSFICGIKGYKLSKSEIKFLRKYKLIKKSTWKKIDG